MKVLYRKMNEQILPPESMKKTIMEKLENPRSYSLLRPLTAIPALLLIVILATPVMAAYVPSIQELMFQVAPNVASRFAPVQVSDTANGIRAEVVSASIHGSTVELYLSFQDLEGNRLDENTHPGGLWLSSKPSLLGSRNGGSHGSISEPLQFDPETKTYYSMIQSSYSVPNLFGSRYLTIKEICGDKVTVNLEELRRTVELEDVAVPITMTEPVWRTIERTDEGIFHFEAIEDMFPGELTCLGLEGGDDIGWFHQQVYTFLAPGEIVTEITDNIAITNMCYVNDELHIQERTKESGDSLTDISSSLHLVDAQGNQMDVHRVFLLDYQLDGERITYREFIYRISPEELKNFTLTCSFTEHQTIPGPWRMTFPLAESDYIDGEDGSILPTADYSSSPGISQGEVHFG